jgi:hypothetical protein
VPAYYELLPVSVGGSGDPERVWGQSTTSNFFDVAEIPMSLGRGFLVTEEQSPVVVLGYRLWQLRFASDPSILGRISKGTLQDFSDGSPVGDSGLDSR